jgi:cytosol aminopeptidase
MLDWRSICCRSGTESSGKEGKVIFINSEESMKKVAEEGIEDTLVLREGTYYSFVRSKDESKKEVRLAAARGAKILSKSGVNSIVVEDGFRPEAVAEGVVLATYQYDLLHSKKKDKVRVVYRGGNEEVLRAIRVAEAQNFARFLGDTPANHMTPILFCEYAKEYLKGVEVFVREKKFVEEKKMGLFLGVNRGSDEEPRILEAVYNGKEGGTEVVLVGKGITFDSGGISLKPPTKMGLMKGDMLGGASVVAVIGALARAKAKVNVAGIVMLTENLPSGKATKPGDVHIGMSGKTVEVDNTDAEGRLVLADGLAYSEKFEAPVVIDIATLTGAIKVSLGGVFAGLFSNDDELSEKIIRAGSEAADPVWRMPCTDDYLEQISSDVADIKNMGGSSGGNSITAALFLREFVGERKWAHLDIAGIESETIYGGLYGTGMSGRPVALLSTLLHSWNQ